MFGRLQRRAGVGSGTRAVVCVVCGAEDETMDEAWGLLAECARAKTEAIIVVCDAANDY